MTAWQKLLACSQLLAGTAWELISSPKTGSAGVVINDGVTVEVWIDAAQAEVADMRIEVAVNANPVAAEVQQDAVEVEVTTAPIEVEIAA